MVALVALFLLALMPAASAASHSYGEMVEYDLVYPVDGPTRLSDTFYAWRSHGDHRAQDLMADKMTPVLAAATGTLRYVNWSSRANDLNPERCCSLVITHDDGWETRYLHLNNDTPGTDDGKAWGIAADLVPGARVEAGSVIGWVGDSGNAENTPSHLHFELHDPDGTIVNPYEALVAAKARAAAQATDPLLDGSRTLRRGSRGDDVRRLQELMAVFGFDPGPADGVFGAMTAAAVRGFQDDTGIEIDGLVGRATKAAIATRLLVTPEVLRRGDRSDAVLLAQEALEGAGFSPGPADGIFGRRTHDAVVAFQRTASLSVDGVVGPKTWSALLR